MVACANTEQVIEVLRTVVFFPLSLCFATSTTPGSDKPWSSSLNSDPISVRTKVPSAGISCTVYFWFPTALPEYLTGGSELSGKCMNCWNCLHKVNWVTLIVKEMQKRKESETVVMLTLSVGRLWSNYGLSNSIKTTLFDLFRCCYF